MLIRACYDRIRDYCQDILSITASACFRILAADSFRPHGERSPAGRIDQWCLRYLVGIAGSGSWNGASFETGDGDRDRRRERCAAGASLCNTRSSGSAGRRRPARVVPRTCRRRPGAGPSWSGSARRQRPWHAPSSDMAGPVEGVIVVPPGNFATARPNPRGRGQPPGARRARSVAAAGQVITPSPA